MRLNQKVLDLGCGSGRHSELLIKQGYQVYGCDVSAAAIKMTMERIRMLNLKGKFEVSYFNSLPYENEFFDMIIAWHSIYYNNFEILYWVSLHQKRRCTNRRYLDLIRISYCLRFLHIVYH